MYIIIIHVYMDNDLLNLYNGLDPFKQMEKGKISNIIHIRYQQRTARKGTTIIEGLEDIKLDDDENKKVLKKLSKIFRKKLSCSCAVKMSKDTGYVLQLSGDHRDEIMEFLINSGGWDENSIKLHGF